ncbi:endopeptidase La [Candidatus Marithrix sp. Canyon 246]|uniref:endopeptidase La n=1 Tax=Candidatus Marithrix sp. Canyon 246 TaxID=1827136 RepID=UPI000849F624|nr:endopeptidase La [Candidatus Marithrix sp. Canyon 246]
MIILPVLPLRDLVVYPYMVVPLFVGREKSIETLEKALAENTQILLVTQKTATENDPTSKDIYDVGTIASILQLLKLPDGTIKLLVEGKERAKINNFIINDNEFKAEVNSLSTINKIDETEVEVLSRSIISQFEEYIKYNQKVAKELLTSLLNIDDPSRLADTIAAHLTIKIDAKQKILEIVELAERLEYIINVIDLEIDLLQVEKRVHKRVKSQMDKSQRDYYLHEQIKAIKLELGEVDEEEDTPNEIDELSQKIEAAGMSKQAKDKALAELKKLKMMSPMSSEATVVRNYLDVLLEVPWKKRSRISRDLAKAENILDSDHYGLEKVKERILEYLAVQQRVKKMKGPILCLVGPPGVGKTSLGKSIANATNRKFVRMSLGGVRDEAEIRGHRRTYIGSMPGKIIRNLSKVAVRNPLFLLDEIDKMSMDGRGDPASALLEVLDPEQNNTFNDHYMDVDYDLSDVMFVATANSLNIPAPLLDRMEVIHLSGYTEDEKLNISKTYLLEKQLKNNGLKQSELSISDAAIRDIIRFYTREAGVRNLERELAKISRKVIREILQASKKVAVSAKNLNKYLGVQRFRYGRAKETDHIGQVTGLAWTEVGGDLLTIEAAMMLGKGKLSYTGQLGDVMQESIQAAMSVVRGRSQSLGIETDFYQKYDLHIHVPEGATPKDGPSAGISMCTAIVSVLTNIPVRSDVAMTGEITLRGEVLPIGGLKEKLLAALRGGISLVLIPYENQRDLAEIPDKIKKNIKIHPVRWIEEVLEIALQRMPIPQKEDMIFDSNVKNAIGIEENHRIQTH